jgi:BirA family biotin operon repressor/biotin-[acetyl-CoA-carboxylase] ligase
MAKSIAASLLPPPAVPATAAAPSSCSISFAPFSPSQFQSQRQSQHIGATLHYSPVVTSTMDLCKEALFGSKAAAASPDSGTVWLADEQTAGRGRIEGRTWSSPRAANLYFTTLLKLHVADGMEMLRKLNQCVCISVAQSLETALAAAIGVSPAALPPALQPRIKWPNDVWIGPKKCCGVLIDVEHCGSEMNVVIGVGVRTQRDAIAVARDGNAAAQQNLDQLCSLCFSFFSLIVSPRASCCRST